MFINFRKKLSDFLHNRKIAKQYNEMLAQLEHWNSESCLEQITEVNINGYSVTSHTNGARYRLIPCWGFVMRGYSHGRSHMDEIMTNGEILSTRHNKQKCYNVKLLDGRLTILE